MLTQIELLDSFQLPPTACFTAVKKAYIRLIRLAHPDHEGGTHAASVALNVNFQLLKAAAERGLLPMEEGEVGYAEIRIDGRSLTEFGLGLGPTTNGRTCDACSGKGYLHYHAESPRNQWQDCPGCAGSGRWQTKACANCAGTGRLLLPAKVQNYHNCFECKGTGEIEIFNPVLPKGRLARV